MTPEQKIKHLIIATHYSMENKDMPEVNENNVDDLYEHLEENDDHWDAMEEVRTTGYETKLPCPSSRHYESDAVAAQAPDGSWVGWTYWYGGGKHGEPDAIDWIDDAYDLNCIETEQVMTVREFSLPA